MAKLRLARDIMCRTKERSILTAKERKVIDRLLAQGSGKGAVIGNVIDFPRAFLLALLDDYKITPNQRAIIAMQVFGMTGKTGNPEHRDCIYNTPISTPGEFGSCFMSLGNRSPNCELYLGGRWYPITLSIQFFTDDDDNQFRKYVGIYGTLSVCECDFGFFRPIHPDLFLDESGQPQERTVLEILNHIGIRGIQTSPAEFNLKMVRAERTARERGRVVLVSGPVLVDGFGWGPPFEPRTFGTPELPRKAVVEAELEVKDDLRSCRAICGQSRHGMSRLPFVRVFSLDLKTYVYADVDDVESYEFEPNAISKLHLPDEMRMVLTRVFNTPPEGLFGDLIRGKHGGLVILACGNPGVGKTLTAEIYAEQTRRPLYVLELGELGTNIAHVEANLKCVFTRVAKWNAVLAFDECEIFLTQRGADLERSAIVGSFLRLLDYYSGILFLTTNRAEVLDHAVLSRVTLKLEYPDLDWEARAAVWKTMLASAGLMLVAGTVEELAKTPVNGRQIRNLTRLAKILYPTGPVTIEQMQGVLGYCCPLKSSELGMKVEKNGLSLGSAGGRKATGTFTWDV
jgi:hypothetical protein